MAWRHGIKSAGLKIGEAAYLEQLAKARARRQNLGGAWRLDYMDSQGRTGSQLASAAGQKGNRYK